jgi:hypothetical protein
MSKYKRIWVLSKQNNNQKTLGKSCPESIKYLSCFMNTIQLKNRIGHIGPINY